ncbi:hypothetical protein PVW47_01515 [Marinovum sp. SP66]|uniref:hypothetical protein n=1 Tax=Marinovum TaxID=367771 RepID=UPI00237AA6FA|nr:hypothetical protein [Marinovum sp. SP66]MDD9738451.1 hypothetical protein [Marinovum sp. SP66]
MSTDPQKSEMEHEIAALRAQVSDLTARLTAAEDDIQHIGKWLPALSADTARLLEIVLAIRHGKTDNIKKLADDILRNYETLNPPSDPKP